MSHPTSPFVNLSALVSRLFSGGYSIREAPTQNMPLLFGHCPFGGGVSTLARMVWGTYLEKNCPSSNGHLLDCGGVKMLARMVWGTYAVKIEVQMGICLC